MPKNIDIEAQKKRKKEALQSALMGILMRLALALLLVWLAVRNHRGTTVEILFCLLAVINLGSVIPIWKSYQLRIKEIEGGEEDAAAQY